MSAAGRLAGLIVLALQLLVLPRGAGIYQAQQVQADWTVGPPPAEGWTVGDPIPLHLTITYPAELPDIDLPELPQNWGPFELREQHVAPLKEDAGLKSLVHTIVVTLWAPGDYETPPLMVRYQDRAGELHEIAVPPAHVSVRSVLDPADQEKRDLKPQVWLPGSPAWPWVLGGLALTLFAGALGWAVWRRGGRRALPSTIPSVASDLRPAHAIAHAGLDRIAALDLPSKGQLKRHYTLIADCLRAYLLNRYGIPAMDLTTAEIVATLRPHHVDARQVELVGELLSEADLVKFARFTPPAAQVHAAVQRARHIVDVTRPATEAGIGRPHAASAAQPAQHAGEGED
jgi:hypothetical protein